MLNVCNGDLSHSSDCILSGPSVDSLIRSVVFTNEDESRKL